MLGWAGCVEPSASLNRKFPGKGSRKHGSKVLGQLVVRGGVREGGDAAAAVQVVEEQVLPKFVRVFLQDKPDKGPDGVDMQ